KAKLKDQPGSKTLISDVADDQRTLDRLKFRINHGDYFKIKKEEDLPQNLPWTSGTPQPEIGDPNAKKGGSFTDYIETFPNTLRVAGTGSNHSFRSSLYDDINLSLVGMHPHTDAVTPSIAREWALDSEANTVYFRLDPDASYTDGVKVRPIDFYTNIYLRTSPFIRDLYAKQYFREQFAGFTIYGDSVIAVTLPEQKPLMVLSASLSPAPTHFYKDYGPDYEYFYQWKVPPSTGAYFVKEEDVVKGRSITLTRAKDWWAKDKPSYKNSFNADKITYVVVRDPSKAFELFRVGYLDFYALSEPKFWYEKTEIEPVFDGYIDRYKFYNQYPRSPRGMHLNLAKPILKDRNIRMGLQYALNFQKVIDVIFRGDFSKMNSFYEGYGEYSHEDLEKRGFNIKKAREFFAKAGYDKMNNEGYLVNSNGERLSVSVSYANMETIERIMSLLQEEAKKVGLHLSLDSLSGAVWNEKVTKKDFEMTFLGWGSGPPFPSFYQFFHSSNAYEDNGEVKTSTNNIYGLSNPEIDALAEASRSARTEEEFKVAALKAQELIHDEALFVPGYKKDYYAFGCWRWVRWPDTKYTPTNVAVSEDAVSSYLWWIDTEMKEETLEAKKNGETFPEVQKIIDTFKEGIPDSFKNL
ncbi:extracellular solute-binding protein, partial [Akkermansiaceae bacterium]|nr:extracellular solute-binding protein [Akkermansiaceae bacterium]